MKQKIDFVITWVDGNDEAWLKQKNENVLGNNSTSRIFNHRDWENLQYWFRSVEKFTPWVNNIYFVTWGHLPKWLNLNHPKLKIINHKEFIPEQYLPTFSSHTIELNLHRIKGLSEYFVYFNDDTFILKNMEPNDFFDKGLPKDCAIINPIAPANRSSISSLQLKNISIINESFNKRTVIRKNFKKWFSPQYGKLLLLNVLFIPWKRFVGLYEMHLPSSFLKQTFEEVWMNEFDILNETCLHKTRSFRDDVNQWLVKEWQLVTGCFTPRSTSIGKLYGIKTIDDAKNVKEVIVKKKKKMICVNDHVVKDFNEIKEYINDCFETILPEKSNYEL